MCTFSIFIHPPPCCQGALPKSCAVPVLMKILPGPFNAYGQIPHPQPGGPSCPGTATNLLQAPYSLEPSDPVIVSHGPSLSFSKCWSNTVWAMPDPHRPLWFSSKKQLCGMVKEELQEQMHLGSYIRLSLFLAVWTRTIYLTSMSFGFLIWK